MARGGRSARRKGLDGEREFVRMMGGERVPLSGATGGSFSGDVILPYLGRGEIKRRRDGFKQLYNWLSENDFLAVRADSSRYVKRPWLIIMRAEDLKLILDELDELKRRLTSNELLSAVIQVLHLLEETRDLVKWAVEVREPDPLLTDIASKLDNVIAELDSAVRDSEIKTEEDSHD